MKPPASDTRATGLIRHCVLTLAAPAEETYRLALRASVAVWPNAPRLFPAALATLVILCAALLVGHFVPLAVPAVRYETGKSSLMGMRLEDGSTLDLAPETTLTVQLLRRFRLIEVSEGELLIHVARDEARPLDILVGDRLVRAVGTTFNVRARNGSPTTVLVTEGKVQLLPAAARGTRHSSDGVLLHASELAYWSAGGPPRVQNASAQEQADVLAWRAHRLTFAGAPLREAVREINRFNTVQIVIDDPSIAEVKIGGRFDASPPERFVEALQSVSVVRKGSTTDANVAEIHLVRAPQDRD